VRVNYSVKAQEFAKQSGVGLPRREAWLEMVARFV
jgi:hypothetical protein